MAQIIPQATDTLNSPSHSFLHRVVTVDSSSPQSSIDVQSDGTVRFGSAIALTDTNTLWTIVTSDGNLAANSKIIANKATLLTVLLPSTAVVGNVIRVVGMNSGLWLISQNADQYIKFGNQTTTTGVTGSLSSVLTYDAVELVCIVANTGWVVVSSVGNITVT